MVAEEQENESLNISKSAPLLENQNKHDSWLCPEKFKENGKYKEASLENTMNELVSSKDLEKEETLEVSEENINESKVVLTRPG